ncbi:MarR family winged helix-turn-helix transcriptional regulator [Actinomadura roseirufa]|uniref:MarR family winged helix-turn-helix transcriptional regulator n=1 Tax=Actinomadura roseirufa TaxID=2094049 RepID=UPI001F5FEAF2|nr:MarR family winged helix-turn-helix transcriptional regulator [Actinomadura roseirufa]
MTTPPSTLASGALAAVPSPPGALPPAGLPPAVPAASPAASPASRPSGAVSAAELTAWRAMLRAQARISRRLQGDLLADHDLALGSYDVLTHLGDAPEGRLRMNDLADRVLLSRSGLTRLVDRLQREGLVARESCSSDARGLYAVLTAAGRDRLDAATPTYRQGVRDYVLSRLDEADLRVFGHILAKLADDPPPAPAPA